MKILTFFTTITLGLSMVVASGATYKIQKGDTLYRVAKKNKVSLSSLLKANGFSKSTMIHPGQMVKIPAMNGSTASSKKPVSRPNSYIVRKGDTFYKISRQHRISVKQLQAWNPQLRANRLAPGMKVFLKPVSSQSSITKKVAEKKSSIAKAEAKVEPEKKAAVTKPVAEKPKAPAMATSPVPASSAGQAVENELSVKRSSKEVINLAPSVSKKAYIEPDINLEMDQKGVEESQKPLDIVSSVTVNETITYSQFAERHGSTIEQLNELNGLSLKPTTTLAKGSELYVRGK